MAKKAKRAAKAARRTRAATVKATVGAATNNGARPPAKAARKARPRAGEQRFRLLEGRLDVVEAQLLAIQAGQPPAVPAP